MINLKLTLLIGTFALCNFTSYCQTAWKGKIIYQFSGSSIKEFNLATKTDKALFLEGKEPFVAKTGEIFFVNDKFGKRDKTIRKSAPPFIQFKDVIDLSSENPMYKKQLEEYSVINRTGNSDVMSRFTDPSVSPDGKYLAVNIFGYGDQVFNKNCVAIFDISSARLVTKFDEKYYGSFTPDGRLVMAGSHKSVSTDGQEYHSKMPGIFITDKTFANVTRIDPDLDDPGPYHPSVSPDGKKIIFILSNHVWVMDLDGKNMKQLTAVDRDNIETFPQWSPDGKFVAAWSYKTFERSYYTAIAIVPSNSAKPVALTDKAPVWPRDPKNFRISGGSNHFNWR